MSGVKRKILSVAEKVRIIRELENGSQNLAVSKKYGLPASTVSTIYKNRKTILLAFDNNLPNCKKLKKCEKNDVDMALLEWFKVQRSAGFPISGPILKVQAEKFAEQLGYKEFMCNNGWIDRFKNRNNIVYAKISGEALSVDNFVVSEWTKNVWPDMRRGYADHDIYNADEAGIFYNLTPNCTLKFKGEKCIGGKLVKHRLTVLMCANMTGTDKRKLLVIGKAARPRCFKHVKKLPVDYTANKKAWMTSQIFENEIRKWDNSLRIKNRKILLLIDNCSAHPKVKNLTNIKLVFLPPNLTSVLQPMDQGVTRSFKSHFRRLLVLKLIEGKENFPETSRDVKISVLDAIRLMSDAWANVTSTAISNCFQKSGLSECDFDQEYDEEDNLPLSKWLQGRNLTNFEGWPEIDDFTDVDKEVATSGLPTDVEILESISNPTTVDSNGESDCEDSVECALPVTWADAESALNVLTKFVESRSASSDETFRLLSGLKNNFRQIKYACCTKQPKIDNYFRAN